LASATRIANGARYFTSFWNTFFAIQPKVGRDEVAREVVYKLHGNDRSSADEEYTQMHDTIKAEISVGRRRLSNLWATQAMLRRTLVAVGVQIFTQFTGINVIAYYGPQIYTSLGITGTKVLLVQGILGAAGPIANLFFYHLHP